MIRVYRDEHGVQRAEMLGGHRNVGAFLEQDVQGSAAVCAEILAAVREVEEGGLEEWTETGNAHDVTVRADGVRIENVWDEGRGAAELSLEEFKECLKVWMAHLTARGGGAAGGSPPASSGP